MEDNTLEYKLSIEKILMISNKILIIYNNLYNLEINNQKNSLDYHRNLNYLDIVLELENNFYQKLNPKLISFYLHFLDPNRILKNLSDYHLIINDLNQIYPKKRIYNRLLEIQNNYLKEKYDDINYKEISLLQRTLKEDINKLFLYYEEKEFNNNSNFKDTFTMTKYILSYLNKDIENSLKENFNDFNKLILLSKSTSDLLEIDEDRYQNYIVKFFIIYIRQEMLEYLNSNPIFLDEKIKYLHQELLLKSFLKIGIENSYIKTKIYDKILSRIFDNKMIQDIQNDNNIITIRSERLILNGNSKRF